MIVSCMEKIFSLFFQLSYKNVWVCAVISSVSILQHHIQVMDQLHTLINLLLLHGTGVDQNVVCMWRGKKKLYLRWIFTWYPGHSLVPTHTELFGVQIHAYLGS